MPQVETSAGDVAYEDTGGDGVPVVLLHGPAQDGTVWRRVVAELGATGSESGATGSESGAQGSSGPGFRCLVPTLPYGSHRVPLRPGAELTPRSMALLIGEFADALKLGDDAVFVENDGGRLQQLVAERPDRVGRLVIAGCEAFDNYPPRAGGKMMAAAARVPGGIALMANVLAVRPLRRVPGTGYAVMAHRPVPDDLIDRWTEPLRKDPVARDVLVRYLRAAHPSDMLDAVGGLRAYDRPALVVWGRQDRMMPPEHGRRLAELLPRGRLVELDDCRTLIPLDRPEGLAAAVRDFVRETAAA
ncbi:alpha/beta hydrolase [Streptomyces sp. NPDC046465]|uniref:alpha/beta fold hydrolase n=1 Tax=Streptomyces sp. NPDC046465 TaxID=3155810 RepID=UPI0033F595FE